MKSIIRIGTRGSALALAQAAEVARALKGAFPALGDDAFIIQPITTTGDTMQANKFGEDMPLNEVGGKSLFTKEIEEALLSGAIDIAVHSMKDMPDALPNGLMVECILEREDPRDVFISNQAQHFWELPAAAKVGTSSVRRRAQVLHRHTSAQVVAVRGNINTRIAKLDNRQVDALILAAAGLKRIGLESRITSYIESDVMLPAVAQGAIGVECRMQDEVMRQMLAAINHTPSHQRICAERGFLSALGGSCSTPMGGLAEFIEGGKLRFRGLLASLDGTEIETVERIGSAADAEQLGTDAGQEIVQRGRRLLNL